MYSNWSIFCNALLIERKGIIASLGGWFGGLVWGLGGGGGWLGFLFCCLGFFCE